MSKAKAYANYINGEWVDPVKPHDFDVINPATEEVCAHISLGSEADVDKAVAAAKAAFETFSRTSRQERVELLESCVEAYKKHYADIGAAISLGLLEIVFVFWFVDFFDNVGTLMSVGKKAGIFREGKQAPRLKRILVTDATATTGGAVLGTSTVVSYIESATGVAEGDDLRQK